MDDMKKKIYCDLRNEADMCMQGKLENFICDLQEDGSELGNANELTPESLENYMYSVLSKAMALWKSPITKMCIRDSACWTPIQTPEPDFHRPEAFRSLIPASK